MQQTPIVNLTGLHEIFNSSSGRIVLVHAVILGKWPTWRTNSFTVQPLATVTVLVAVSYAHDTATNTEWQLPEVVLIQFVSPDDEHDVLETSREL
jgi:hypothetical protein